MPRMFRNHDARRQELARKRAKQIADFNAELHLPLVPARRRDVEGMLAFARDLQERENDG